MKIYFHPNLADGSNTYIILNKKTKESIIVDPGKITKKMIEHIETDGYTLTAIIITHSRDTTDEGISTLRKVYNPKIFSADSDLFGEDAQILQGDGLIKIASFDVSYFAIAGHTPDSMAFKIKNALFSGDTLLAGVIGKTTNPYSRKLLQTNVQTKLLVHPDDTIIYPCHGPLTSIGSEKKFNLDFGCPLLQK